MADPKVDACLDELLTFFNEGGKMQRYEFYDKCTEHGTVQGILEGEYLLIVKWVKIDRKSMGDIYSLKPVES